MRIAVLHFLNRNNKNENESIKKLVSALEANSHQVAILDGFHDMANVQLPIYEYVFILAKPLGFFSPKLPPEIANVLSKCGNIIGMKSCALLISRGLGFLAEKSLLNLMTQMEHEGMFVMNSAVIDKSDAATYYGKQLK